MRRGLSLGVVLGIAITSAYFRLSSVQTMHYCTGCRAINSLRDEARQNPALSDRLERAKAALIRERSNVDAFNVAAHGAPDLHPDCDCDCHRYWARPDSHPHD